MNQIYYTQCPIGYGLGASNGFQIKRLSSGYPVSGDFRHFSLRAFVAGTRQPAPATLRYRRGEGDVAEIAWLTPRSHEYETERGPWGRPGGHFAHGLQLDAAELRALGDWPAGLFDRPFWTRSDREPSRGQPPPDLALSAADLGRPPSFAAVAPLADGQDRDRLARLLTALAAAARAGRTLFLIDEPARLAERIALLTFAFPEPWRASLTFSTYHDRPEELPGFRLQGTIPAARPNRLALLAQGFVADLTAAGGTVEPEIEPAGWARVLAGWLLGRREVDQADWESTRRRALRARAGQDGIWADEWLERMFALPRWIREPPPVPRNPRDWSELVRWSAWTNRAGLTDEWTAARPPAWWLAVGSGEGVIGPESIAALLQHLRLPEAWQGNASGETWGEVVARWVAPADDAERLKTTAAALTAAPAAARPAFAGGLIRGLPPEASASTLSWLAAQTTWDRSMLLPLQAHSAATAAIEGHDGRKLQNLLAQCLALPGATAAVLDALEAEASDRPATRLVLAEQLALALGTGATDPRGVVEVHGWALGLAQTDATEAWLAPYWTRLFADRLNIDLWRTSFQQIPRELARRLTPVVLHVAIAPQAVDEALRWAIEELVLPLPEHERPFDATWPGAYLDRLPSGLDLLIRLVKKPYQRLGVRRWLDQARERGELSEAQGSRLDDCERYERVLRSGDARALLDVKLPAVPAEERGTLLSQILRHLGDGSDEAINLALDTCRAAWPAGFDRGVAGLAPLAKSLAEPLLPERGYPDLWLERLQRIVDRLGLAATQPAHGFEPDSLAALVVAATTRHPGDAFDPWRLRESLLRNDLAWKALGADIRVDLEGLPAPLGLKVLDDWDQSLAKGSHTKRFYELWFNVCDSAQLVHAVVSRAVDTKNFAIPWWDADRCPGAVDDVRDRLVRQAPLIPLREGSLTPVRHWLRRPLSRRARSSHEDLAPIEGESAPNETYEWLISDDGRLRWSYIEELSLFSMAAAPGVRLERLKTWYKVLPLDRLAVPDRYQFLASVIRLIDEDDPVLIDCLAKWLSRGGVSDIDQIKCWNQRLSIVEPVPDELILMRVALVRRLCDELNTIRREERERGRKTGITGSP